MEDRVHFFVVPLQWNFNLSENIEIRSGYSSGPEQHSSKYARVGVIKWSAAHMSSEELLCFLISYFSENMIWFLNSKIQSTSIILLNLWSLICTEPRLNFDWKPFLCITLLSRVQNAKLTFTHQTYRVEKLENSHGQHNRPVPHQIWSVLITCLVTYLFLFKC